MNSDQNKESGYSILVYLVFGIIFLVVLWHWVPELIRRTTITFHPAESFPISGTFVSSQYRYDPTETRNSKLTLERRRVEKDDNHYLEMTYQPDTGKNSIRIMFIIEEWQQVLMRERDKTYRHNIALRAHQFFDETGNSIDFQFTCRLVGKDDSFGPSFGRYLYTNDDCKSQKGPISMVGHLSRSGAILCVNLNIKTQSEAYHIEHRPQLMQCLKYQDNR